MIDTAASASSGDIRPLVAKPVNNRAPWIFAGGLTLAAIILFAALESKRSAISSPAISAASMPADGTMGSAPELSIPPEYPVYGYGYPRADADPAFGPTAVSAEPARLPPVRLTATKPARTDVMTQAPAYAATIPPATYQPQMPTQPVFPNTVSENPDRTARARSRAQPGEKGESNVRVWATRLENPSTTVPQGTVMQAVLETALDSSRAGFARAVVSRDVSSFDGSRVLVPKGSKLFGEYQSDVGRGQNRALIRWHRLTRPDGAIIDVDSPSADPLGRAGVKGKVNSHFLERFSGAILQSALDVGVHLATRRAAGDTFVVALPQGTRDMNSVKPEEIKPTVTVKQGKSVSVFIARDLDFTDVE